MNTYRDEQGNMVAKLSPKTVSYLIDNAKHETTLTVKNFKTRRKVKVLLFKDNMSMQINSSCDRLYFWAGSYIEL